MLKKILLIVLVLLAALAGVYWYLEQNKPRTVTNMWQLVPGNAVAVLDLKEPATQWQNTRQQDAWRGLRTMPYFKGIQQDMAQLDSLFQPMGLQGWLQNQQVLLSMHITGSNQFGFVYYLPIEKPQVKQQLFAILKQMDRQYGTRQRTWHGFNINEISHKPSKRLFSWLRHENYLVGSFSSVLVEDVIRNLEGNTPGFRQTNKKLFADAQPTQGTHVYLNMQRVAEWLGTFLPVQASQALRNAGAPGQVGQLEYTQSNDVLALNGFTWLDPNQAITSLPATLSGQKESALGALKYVSNRTALLYHLNATTNPKLWLENLEKYRQQQKDPFLQERNQLFKEFDVNQERFLNWFQGEVALSVLESIEASQPDRLLLLRATDMTEGMAQLRQLTDRLNANIGDTLYQEMYSQVPITYLPASQMPARLLGPLFKGFDECFYAPVGSYILIGNSIQGIKRCIQDFQTDNTWAKSVSKGSFMDQGLPNSNYSVFVDVPRYWNMLLPQLHPIWQKAARSHENILKNFDMLGLEMANAGANRFFTSMLLRYAPQNTGSASQSRYRPQRTMFLDAPAITQPYAVRNAQSKKLEVLVQDSALVLYHFDHEGRRMWADTLPGPVVDQVQGIDYYNDNHTQYLVPTQNAVVLLDGKGQHLPGSPLTLPNEATLAYARVVDYDGSKRYRFLVADTQGRLYLYDKALQPLTGWDPLPLERPLACAPFHIRVRSRDRFVAVQQDGVVHVLNRRGEAAKGFPLKLNGRVETQIFTDVGTRFSNTTLSTITTTGELVRFNLEGTFQSRNQLYRPDADSRFFLVPDGLGRNFLLARQDLSRMTLSARKLSLQYYGFNARHEVYAVTDGVQDYTYLYNYKGQLLGYQPASSGYPIALLYFDNLAQYQVYVAYNNNVTVYAL